MRRSSELDWMSGIGISRPGVSGRFMGASLPYGERPSRGRLRPRARLALPETRVDRRRDAPGIEAHVGEQEGGVAVVDEAVGQAKVQDRDGQALAGEKLG